MKGSSLRRLAARRQGARRDIRIQNHSRADTVATKLPAAPFRGHPSSKDGSRKKGQTVVGDEEGPPCTKQSFGRRAQLLSRNNFQLPTARVDRVDRAIALHFDPFAPRGLVSSAAI